MVIRMILGLLGLMWAGYGAWCFADPGMLRDVAGVSASRASGSVDLRTDTAGKAINLNGATVGSTSGQVQLIAGGDITTSTADGSTREISTSGNALLHARLAPSGSPTPAAT